jgi:hypothetical protein
MGLEVLTLRGAPPRHKRDPAFNARILFSPDGRRLAASNWDESMSIWDAPLASDESAIARQQAERRRNAVERAPFWHLQEAERCLEHADPSAAAFHLRQLTNVTFSEPLQRRYAAAVARLVKAPPSDPR